MRFRIQDQSQLNDPHDRTIKSNFADLRGKLFQEYYKSF